MSQEFKVYDYDIIYLSYDEPNAEENYYDLKQKIPWAKRVHGVEGSDAAHKACANLAETDRFITIDGDNKINGKFVSEVLQFADDVDLSKCVVSWSGYNMINGLTYGNGGIKCWPTELVKTMRTHENADPNNAQAQVDFCWDLQYLQVDKTYSYVYNNTTPWQAWRAGFREGVKMSLLEGLTADPKQFTTQIPKKNLDRLRIWCSVGSDVTNGDWAMYGAREGCYKTMCTDWDHVNVRDFEYLNDLWKNHYSKISLDMLPYEIMGLGETLNHELDLQIPVDPYDETHSKFFKSVYVPPERTPQTFLTEKQTAEYDIVMITYNEPNADKNYDALKEKFPRAKRVDGVKGIPNAHREAAKLCTTDLIWIVDGDAEIVDGFNFDYRSPDREKNYVKVWRSVNPINGLEYGYGGIKLFPRQATLDMDITKPDMTTSISRHFKPIKVVSNITAFNTDPFSAWKSGFRECAKLASSVIDRQKQNETDERLDIWCKDADENIPYANYAVDGARAGRAYGEKYKDDLQALNAINDFDWLKEQFNTQYQIKEQPVAELDNNEIKDLLDRFELLYEGPTTDIRRFYNDKDLNSLKRLVTGNEDIFKILDNDQYALWRTLDKVTKSSFIKPLKKLYSDPNFDKDCFSRGQLKSKLWLVKTLKDLDVELGTVFLCAGWYATIVPMLVEQNISFNKIRSFDVDESVWKIAETFNKQLTTDGWKFKAQTLDIHKLKYNEFEFETIKSNGDIEKLKETANTVINTSCEHIVNFKEWYNNIPQGKLVVLQSNNFTEVDEHVNCVRDSLHFAEMAPLSKVYFTGELELDNYTRYMRIGYK